MWAASGVVSWWAKRRYDKYAAGGMALVGANEDPGGYCDREAPAKDCTRAEATDAANHYQAIARWVGTPIFIAGSLAVGGAIVMYVTAPEKERIDQTVFTPVVSPNEVGFALSRRF